MANVVGLFDTIDDAQAVIRELETGGFTKDRISFIAQNKQREYGTQLDHPEQLHGAERSQAAAGFGATGGSVIGGLGGLLVGLGAMTIPGIGPLIGAGTLATTLGITALGAGFGAATGGLVGVLVGAGIPEETAQIYTEGVLRGGALVMVNTATDAETERAAEVMQRHNVASIEAHGQ